MLILTCVAALLLVACIMQPDLPLSRGLVDQLTALLTRIRRSLGLGRALVAIGLVLVIYAGFWALQGDAPLFLAMILPELAAWLTTFEIATLAEALLGVGTAFVALKAAGVGSYLKGRIRARRTRRVVAAKRKAVNDDEPGGWALAA